MRPPVFVRTISDEERQALEKGLRSSDAFVLRRCQIVLASGKGVRAPQIAATLCCDDQTVLNAIRAFNHRGLASLTKGSSRPHTIERAFTGESAQALRGLLHTSPREVGKDTSVWTLELAAEVSFELGLTKERVPGAGTGGDGARHIGTLRRALAQSQGVDCLSRPAVRTKKKRRDWLMGLASSPAHPQWALGFQDEVWWIWWSRIAQPHLHSWAEDKQPMRLIEKEVPKGDADPKALACYGLWLAEEDMREMLLRFVDGRPISAMTTRYLEWCCRSRKLWERGKRVLVMVWDNAPWHVSKEVREWIKEHNYKVKYEGGGNGVRILACYLPSKSPWLNPIEPKWLHGKRRVVEAQRLLSSQELAQRVCDTYGTTYEAHLSIPEKVA